MTRLAGLGTGLGCPDVASRLILGRAGRPKNGQELPTSVPWPAQRRSKSLLVSHLSACGAPTGAERVLGSISRRSRLAARKLRCAPRISFCSVLLAPHEISNERVHVSRMSEKPLFSASKSSPTQRAQATNFERESTSQSFQGARELERVR